MLALGHGVAEGGAHASVVDSQRARHRNSLPRWRQRPRFSILGAGVDRFTLTCVAAPWGPVTTELVACM
jgi:hypothetical protein